MTKKKNREIDDKSKWWWSDAYKATRTAVAGLSNDELAELLYEELDRRRLDEDGNPKELPGLYMAAADAIGGLLGDRPNRTLPGPSASTQEVEIESRQWETTMRRYRERLERLAAVGNGALVNVRADQVPSDPERVSAAHHASAPISADQSDLLSEILSAGAARALHRNGRISLAGRIPRLSTTFRRTLTAVGVPAKSAASRAVFATIGALGDAPSLPGPGDFETRFAPGRA